MKLVKEFLLGGLAAIGAIAAALAAAQAASDPTAGANGALQNRCDWEACAIHLCKARDGCVQLTDYQY
jgi:hypothetical protein